MASLNGRRYYFTAKGIRKFIDANRSRLMQQVFRHRKGRKMSQTVKRKIKIALRVARQTRRTKHGRPVKWKR